MPRWKKSSLRVLSRSWSLLALLVAALLQMIQAAFAGVVEVFPVAYSPPGFGRLPLIRGNVGLAAEHVPGLGQRRDPVR